MWFVLEHRLKEEGKKKQRPGSNKCLQQVRWICCEAASTLFLSAYPFSRRYSQTVFVSVEATDLADLSDEVDVFLVLRLLTLASLVFSTEVEETAGEDKVAAGIRRPIIWKRRDKINLHSADHYSLMQSDYRGLVLLKHFSTFTQTVQTGSDTHKKSSSAVSNKEKSDSSRWGSTSPSGGRFSKHTHTLFTHHPLPIMLFQNWRDQLALELLSVIVSPDDSPGCYNGDPRCELVRMVPNQPVCTRE